MDLTKLSDAILLGKVEALAETERFHLVDFLIHLGELDTRDACQDIGYASAFAYLTRRLGYAECDAVRRVRVARAARTYPSILRMLANGELHLVGVAMIAPLLTSANHERLLRKAARRSTREVERLVAELSPALSEPRDRMRALPSMTVSAGLRGNPPQAGETSTSRGDGPVSSPELIFPLESPMETMRSPAFEPDAVPRPPMIEDAPPASASAPAAPARGADCRVVFTFVADEQVRRWFERARDLLRHRFPMGRMEDVIGEALKRLVAQELSARLGRRATGRRKTPPPFHSAPGNAPGDTRRIPRWVRREVRRRDSGRCAFIGSGGMRCGETAWLEWDHIVPWALGGRSNDPTNIRLLCRAHNQSQARRVFGKRARAKT